MLKLIIGNRAYSSWSMRGWLAVKQSGEPFEEYVVPLFDAEWEKRREGDEFAPSLGKVPILWDGDCVVWDSLAIIEFLADRVGRDIYWPKDETARAVARSMSAEMHSGFANLRRELPMNVRKSFAPRELSDEVREEIDRIMQLWAQARARFGGTGEFLFGEWCAADMMYAPVVTRFITYAVPVPNFAGRVHEGGPVPAACRRMDRQGPGRALGDRGIRSRGLAYFGLAVSIGRAVLVDVAVVGGPHHVDVGIAAAGIHAAADDDEGAVRAAFVAQMVAVGAALGPGRAISGAQHGAAVILDQHRFALQHDQEFVLAVVPVPLRRPGAGLRARRG